MWDWINEVLYWTDEYYHKIEVYNPTTGERTTLFSLPLNYYPRGILVDPITG